MGILKLFGISGPVLLFISVAFWSHCLIYGVARVHERYFVQHPDFYVTPDGIPVIVLKDHDFTPTHIPIYLLAEFVTAIPILAFWLPTLWLTARPVRRLLWAGTGAVMGLALSFVLEVPHIALEEHFYGLKDVRTWLWGLLGAVAPKDRVSLANMLMNAGFVVAVCVSRTRFAKRLDSGLPQHDEDPISIPPPEEPKADSSSPKWWRHPATVFFTSIGMLWITAAKLTKIDESYISFFSKPENQTTKAEIWVFGSAEVIGLLMYLGLAVLYLIAVRTFLWNSFCAAVSGIVCGFYLWIMDKGASWQVQAQDLAILLFVVHLGVIFGFFSRHTTAAHRFYKTLGVDHPAATSVKNKDDVKEVPVAFKDEKNTSDEKEKSTV